MAKTTVRLAFAILPLIFNSVSLLAANSVVKKEAQVPPGVDFVRSLDIDTYVERINHTGLGAQSARIRLRFRDPENNAFVGMVAGFHHFNQDMRLGDPVNGDTAGLLANWGAAFGRVWGKHLWELDLMGANFSDLLGFAPAVVGEHHIGQSWLLWHRTELNLFTGDTIVDADQGVTWMCTPWLGWSAGYRIFASQHMSRSGPHIGLRFYFESPKIPFIFPSIG